MEFINLTPHAITVESNNSLHLLSAGVARCATIREELCYESGIRLVRQVFGQVEGLPPPKADTVYIVSALVLSALKGTRSDVVAPDTGPDAIRENGQIVAVRGFVV